MAGQGSKRTRRGGGRSWMPWLAALGGVGALGYLRQRYQHRATYLPERYPTGLWNPRLRGLEAEDVWFETVDHIQLHGWWIPHPEARGTILYCHGRTGSLAHYVRVFRRLQTLEMSILAFDYRGYGRSAGKPGERGLCADARAAYDYLQRELGQRARDIILFGHSLGGAVAVDCARHRPVAGLVVESSFTDLRDMARLKAGRFPIHWIARNGFRSIKKVGKLECPKLFIHGTADSTVPLELGLRLFDAAAEPKELLLIEGASHHDTHLRGGETYYRRLVDFFDFVLGF
ncbi:MAG: alpha/beta hydrolase [Thermoanaerobaculia bacterium]|nr:alpha/beta hydrolase [Thermoanaerobaculia bacterium]